MSRHCLLPAVLVGVAAAEPLHMSARPWMVDPAEPPASRARKLLDAMNMSEKVRLMHGSHSEDKAYGWYVGRVAGNPRLGIPNLQMNDGPQGFRDMNNSHRGSTTAYPSGLAVAATFDEAMARLWGESMGEEFAGKGANVQLGPGMCIARVPRNGRNFEYMSGEDPFLGFTLTQRAVRGIQSKGVIANAKHWVNNNQETNRTTDTAVVDERTRFEIYYPPFEGAIKAGVGSVMCSYNRIQADDGAPQLWSCENPETLREDLKRRLGFQGWVMSDWGATHSPSINAGLDQEMPAGGSMNKAPGDPGGCNNLCALIRDGTVSEATVNASALRILTPMFDVGLFDHDVTQNGTTQSNVTSAAHAAAARAIAAAGAVLLKNDGRLLPLAADTRSVAVIGAQGADPYVHGGGSGAVAPARVSAPLSALRTQLGIVSPAGPVTEQWPTKVGRGGCGKATSLGSGKGFASAADAVAGCKKVANCTFFVLSLDPSDGAGTAYWCSSDGYDSVNNAGRFPRWVVGHKIFAPPPPPTCSAAGRCVYYDDGTNVASAAATAAKADVAVVFAATDSGEGSDRAALSLDPVGAGVTVDALVRAVAGAAPRVVVAATAPGAVLTPWRDAAGAVVLSFMPGQEYGAALVDVLFGVTAPSGRLPLTLPNAENEMNMTAGMYPGVDRNVSHYTERLEVGYRWYDAHGVAPAYPFGHGLSYTTFEYNYLRASQDAVSFSLTNTGPRDGAEVVQLYLGFPAAAGEPPAQLKGFRKVAVKRGETVGVTLALDARARSIWDAAAHGWAAQPGEFRVMVGASSRDIRLRGTFTAVAAA